MKCVNRNSKEFKKLQNITGMGELTLATRIGKWQDLNNSNDYPSFNELTGVAEGSIRKYVENPNLELIGTDIQFGQYVKQTGNTSEEGFVEYLSTLNNSQPLTTRAIPASVYVNTSNIKSNWSEKTVNLIEGPSIDSDIKKTYFNNKNYDNVVVSDMVQSFANLDIENTSKSALTLLKRISSNKELSNIKINVSSTLENNNAAWDSVSNVITISRDALSELPADELIRTVLHEVVHAKTASAILEPSTPEEHQLLSDVRQFMSSYSSLSNAYGFTNEMEFVAELYSNPEFNEEVRTLYNDRPIFRNVFQKILDSLRRLFNLQKPNEFDKLMESVVFNTEISDYRQLRGEYGIFHLQNGKIPSHVGYDNKIDRLRDFITNNMEEYRKYLKIKKNTSKSSRDIKAYDELIEKMNKLEAAEGIEKLQLIMSYMTDLKSIANTALNNSKKLKRNISGTSAYKELNNLKRLLGFLDAKDYVQDLMDYVNDTFISSKGEYTKVYSNELSKEVVEYILKEKEHLDEIQNMYTQIEGSVNMANKKLATRIASSITMNQAVEADFKNQFIKEFNNDSNLKNIYKNEDHYVVKMMERHKKDIKEALDTKARDLIENPTEDIDSIDMGLLSYHQVNSGLFDLLKNLAEEMDIKMKDAFRKWNVDTHILAKAYNKFNNALNQKQKFKNILTLGKNNKYYLTNEIQQSVLDNYREVQSKIVERLYKNNKAFSISNEEHANIQSIVGVQSIFRQSHNTEVGDIINMRKTEDKTSSINSKVVEIVKYGAFDTLTAKQKHELANFLGFENMSELNASKLYATEKSQYSKLNKDVYEYLKNKTEGSLDVIRYNKQERENIDYSVQPEMIEYYDKYFNKHINERVGINDEVETYETFTIKDEYRNQDYDKLSKEEVSAINWAKEALRESKEAFDTGSLLKTIPNVKASKDSNEALYFYEYPSVEQSMLEMRANGDFKKMIEDQKSRLTSVKNDEIDEGGHNTVAKKTTYQTRPNYRNFIEPDKVSFSFFDVITLEREQTIKHKFRKQYSDRMLIIRDVAENKQYTKINKSGGKNNVEYFSGEKSNELTKINGLLETFLYDIHSYNDTYLWGKYQANKVAGLINGFGASVALTFNEASGVANILNGMAQLHLDAVGGLDYKFSNLLKAEKFYNKDLPNIIKDLTNPFKESFTNQIVDHYNVLGGVSLAEQEHIKSYMINKFGSTGMLNMYNEMGEHMMNSVLTMAILDGIKVLDNHGVYLNKQGERVYDIKEAASLLDMHYIDKDTGLLKLHSSVQYTTHTPNADVTQAVGRSQISMLIKRRVSDMFGDYDTKRNGELGKKWYGKTLLMFKRFFMPGAMHRWRGAKNIFKHPDEINQDTIKFNTALKRHDEGYYVPWVRMMYNVVPQLLKSEGLKYTKEYYNNLSVEEQAAIRKTTTELILTFVILPAIGVLLSSSFGDDDDKPYFLMYQVDRLSTELGQFYNPLDMTKLVKNPIAGLGVIQNSLKLINNIATINPVPAENEHFFEALSQDREGNYKIIKSSARLLPGVNRAFVEYNDMYNRMQQ